MTSRLAALAITAALLGPSVAQAQTTARAASVIGRGQVELKPARGTFSVGASRRAATSNAARAPVNARINAIVAGLRALGIPREQIQTREISVQRFGRRARKRGP